MADDPGDRTEQPTEQKLRRAREQGQAGKSQDLGAAVMLIAAALLLAAGGAWATAIMYDAMRATLAGTLPGDPVLVGEVAPALRWLAARVGMIVLPVMALMFLFALFSQLVQVGWAISPKAIAPKFERLNPISGAKRLFGVRGVVKLATDLTKLLVILAVAIAVVSGYVPALGALPRADLGGAMEVSVRAIVELVAWMLLVLLAIALIDFRYQKWQHRHDNKMTKQEVKDERRSMEGDPDIRQRRMRAASEIANQRVNADVPAADVVVANPTHFSVAIRYDSATMNAPRVVAKGADWLALRIREVARLHGVPVVERPPLARGLYRTTEVGREISPEHYEAVAEVLAYVYRIEGRAAAEADAGAGG